MVESDALGRRCAFIFVTLIGNEQIEISGVPVLEVSREGKAPRASRVCLPQRLPAFFALVLFSIQGVLREGQTVPVYERCSTFRANKSAVPHARRVSFPVVTKFCFLARKNHKERPSFFVQGFFELAYSLGGKRSS